MKKKKLTPEAIFDKLDENLSKIVSDIYVKYIQHKDYYEKGNEEDSEILIRDDPIDWRYFVYYHNDNPIAFTELITYNKHLITGQFAWDYEDPKLSAGIHTQYFEINYFRKIGYRYDYLCPGYETVCIWKN